MAFGAKLPGWVGHEQIYHLNLTENKTTYDRMFSALRETAEAGHNPLAFLRDISLDLRKPRFKDPVKKETFEFFNPRLNDLQKKAVWMAIEAEDVLVVHGPPGTGKTSVLIEMIRQAKRADETVLVSAPSNAACDHLVQSLVSLGVPVTRLGHPARMTEAAREHTLSFKLAKHSFAKLIDEHEARIEQILRQLERRQERRSLPWEEEKLLKEELTFLRRDIRELKGQIFLQVWNASDVVVATHTVAGDPLITARNFDWVIIDEATQGIEPATWIPAARGKKLVLAGDHCQLPPTVFSNRSGRESLNYTLFERFCDVLGEESKIRLGVQYRMNKKIMDFPSREFYEDALEPHTSNEHHLLAGMPGVERSPETEMPVVFLDTAGLGYEDEEEPGSLSRFNREEAGLVCKEYERLLQAGVPPSEIALISPYSAQVKLISSKIQGPESEEDRGSKFSQTEIDSIDSFQGREKEAVVVSLVRSNLNGKLGFLTDIRRMNVAMTRARRKLVVIGDSATLSSLPFYKDFLDYVESIGGYRSAWEYVE